MSSHVEQIKEKLSIVDVVGSYITVEKAGANFKARCPFHNEKTPSFFISPARNSYYCFGCGAKGDIISFVQDFEGLDFMGALKILAERAGVALEREHQETRTERERLYIIMEHATLFFQKQLRERKDALEYLKNRGLKGTTVHEWRIGFAPLEWRALYDYLRGKGARGEDIEKAGLVKKPERSDRAQGEYYDRFRGRIMFPIFDASGRPVAFSGRTFLDDGTQAKYLNSPETLLFEKSKILYGYHKAKLDIRKQDFSLLVEGQMDLVMSHQSGIGNAVASSGTALTLEQLELLRRLSDKVVIAYDGDKAGAGAAARGWQLALGLGMDVRIAVLPQDTDPADLALKDPEALKKAIKDAQHLITVELSRAMKEESDKRMLGQRIQKSILPLIADLQSSIEQAHFISETSKATGIPESALREDLAAVKAKRKGVVIQTPQEQQQKKYHISRMKALERMLAGVIYWQERQEKPTVNPLDIRQKFSRIIGEEAVQQVLAELEPQKEELIFEAEASFASSPGFITHFNELVDSLEDEHIREEFAQAMKELQLAERAGDKEKSAALLKRCQELGDALSKLQKKQRS